MLRVLGVTIPGLEDFLCEEIRELIGATPAKVAPGKIEFLASPEDVILMNYMSRTATRFLVVLFRGIIDPMNLENIKKAALEVDWPTLFHYESLFAVRAERTGNHEFTSVEVAATIGEAIVERFLADTGNRIRANLRRPDVLVRAYVTGNLLIIGLDTSGESLHRRGYRIFNHRTSLNPIIAYSLVKLSKWLDTLRKDPEVPLIDPMCGGGTIPIEAVLATQKVPPGKWRRYYPVEHIHLFSGVRQEEVMSWAGSFILRDLNPCVVCMDISPKSIAGAKLNADSAGVKMKFLLGDASKLGEYFNRIGAVVTDPPFELRMGRNRRLSEVFRGMSESLQERLELRFSAISAGPALPKLMNAMRVLKLVYNRRILYGGVEARLLAYERRNTKQESCEG